MNVSTGLFKFSIELGLRCEGKEEGGRRGGYILLHTPKIYCKCILRRRRATVGGVGEHHHCV
jgi:hypothetical protein